MKKNILVALTILMVCVFSLVSCDIMGVNIPFLGGDTEETSVEPGTNKPASSDETTDQDSVTTTTPPVSTTIKKPTTTPKPSTTSKPTPDSTTVPTPSITDKGPNTDPGYGPIDDLNA